MPDSRTPLISGNWKMHHNHFEAIQVVQKLSYAVDKAVYDRVDVSVHPPFTDIRSVQVVLQDDDIPIFLGAQNCHTEDQGAYTGEVSAAMLAKLDVTYVIVGHSERRQLFAESDELVRLKIDAVHRNGMTPILCVGETLSEREQGETERRVTSQVEAALAGLTDEQVAAMVIAYEPIWAIGTGKTATPADAQTVCGLIRDLVRQHKAGAADAVRIQYGGSVKPANIVELMAQPDIDGALVGGASLDPDEFSRIIRFHEA